MEFGVNITRVIFFFKNYGDNQAGRLVPDRFLVFKKALYEVKPSGLQLSLLTFLNKPFFYTTKKASILNILKKQELYYLENEKSF